MGWLRKEMVLADETRRSVVLAGNVGVGKSVLFEQLSLPARSPSLSAVESPMPIPAGHLRRGFFSSSSEETILWDTPGVYTLLGESQDEQLARQLLFSGEISGVLQVLDAKNLRRSLVLALQWMEFSLPTVFALNMIDEAENRGIEISRRALEARLGAPVQRTVATEGEGVEELADSLSQATKPRQQTTFPAEIEEVLSLFEELLKDAPISPRALGILLLAGAGDALRLVEQHFGAAMLEQIGRITEGLQRELTRPLKALLLESYQARADRIIQEVQRLHQRSPRFLVRFGLWSQRLSTGIPIAIAVLVAMYYWVGAFAATFLVDLLNAKLFGRVLIPWFKRLVAPIPSPFVREALVNDDFGVLTTGLFLAFGIVLPVLFCFYLFFGLLEESGYLPRFSVLLHRVLKKIGLNGKGLIPLVMGLSCITMAILTTRMLETRRERTIVTFLLLLGLPCAPLLGVMMVILGKMPWYTPLFVFGFIIVQTGIAGWLAHKVSPGLPGDFVLELPPMRLPHFKSILRKSTWKTYNFMKEAVPLFLLASFLVFIFHWLGGLAWLQEASRPLMGGLLGLPEESVQVFIKTIIRRENGATELAHFAPQFDNLQLVVTLLVMTFLMPCVNAIIVIFKEQGLRRSLLILSAVFVYALLAGGLVHHVCRLLGITFGGGNG